MKRARYLVDFCLGRIEKKMKILSFVTKKAVSVSVFIFILADNNTLNSTQLNSTQRTHTRTRCEMTHDRTRACNILGNLVNSGVQLTLVQLHPTVLILSLRLVGDFAVV